MSPTATTHLTALELAEKIQQGERTATELVEQSFQTIDAHDSKIQAFLSHTQELALQTAANVDAKAKAGETLPLLAGVPIAVKDNINVLGTETTCASQILKGYKSTYNATVVEKLLANGLPIVGKTNLDEFAMGSSNENSSFFDTKNPWDTNRVPGGSSGGSAACVSAGMVPLSLGSDTGGSVRQPAALCGLVGLKPTYGTVSRYGLVAFASSLDQISPFARTVDDTAAIYQVIAGHDNRDSTSRPDTAQLLNTLANTKLASGDLTGTTIGVITELDGESDSSKESFQPDTTQAFHQAIEQFKALGATIKPISLPSLKYAVAAYYILATAEASSNLGRFDGVRYGNRQEDKNDTLHPMYKRTRSNGFGPEVKRRIMLGTFSLSAGYYDAFYGKAQQVRQLLKTEFNNAFGQVDALICPTSPSTAFKIGEKSDDPVAMYLSDISTIPINLAGIPALSLPCGKDSAGLPIGLQIIAPHFAEPKLFSIAKAYETASGFTNWVAPL